jgi:hypothetical protein
MKWFAVVAYMKFKSVESDLELVLILYDHMILRSRHSYLVIVQTYFIIDLWYGSWMISLTVYFWYLLVYSFLTLFMTISWILVFVKNHCASRNHLDCVISGYLACKFKCTWCSTYSLLHFIFNSSSHSYE